MTDTHTIAARQNRLAMIMERIAASYDQVTPQIHHLDRMPLPSRGDAAAIIEALEEIIFPGYYSSGGVTHHGIIYRVQERTGWLFEHLREWQVGGSCQSCNAYDLCHGGCMAVKHFTGRSLDSPDPDCVFGNDEPESTRPAGDFVAIGSLSKKSKAAS